MPRLKLEELSFDRLDALNASRLSKICPAVLHSGDSMRQRWHLGERRTFNYLWVFIGSGEGVFKVNGEEFKVASNDFVWIPPNTLHEMSGSSETMHCIFAHVELLYKQKRTRLFRVPGGVRDISEFREFIQPAFGDEEIDLLCGLVKLANPLYLKGLFTELCRTHRLEPGKKLKLAGLLLEILDEILNASKLHSPIEKCLAKADLAIRGSIGRNLDVAALARSVGLSASHFRKVFRAAHGMGPLAFHRHLRIQEACNLLLRDGMNVSETANALGFSNVQGFTRAFGKLIKETPKSFKRSRTLFWGESLLK